MEETGIELIAAERRRQIEEKGFTANHDNKYGIGVLCELAQCYLKHCIEESFLVDEEGDIEVYQAPEFPEGDWPPIIDRSWWKPETPLADLIKAGALIAAEIDIRLRRDAENKSHGDECSDEEDCMP